MGFTRTFDLLERYAEKFSDKDDALVAKVGKEWVKRSTTEYIETAYNISYGLMELGFRPGDTIATIANNRPEWNITDHGLSMLGIIHVPIFATLEAPSYEQILEHSESKMVMLSDASIYKKVNPLKDKISTLESVYSMNDIEGVANWLEIVELGKQNADKHRDELEKIKSGITKDDCVTLIYTSGTTGNSKGVLLSHNNLVSNFMEVSKVFGMTPDQRYLCILPLCHVGERMANYSAQYSGASIYYAQSMASIADDLKDVKPHAFGTVPRILEKIYDKVVQRGEALEGMKKKMFFWALKLGHEYNVEGKSLWYRLQLKLASKIIFSKWREAIGGNIQSVGVGGAALQPRLERVFWAAGVRLLNMYGLTETSPVCTINRLDNIVLGSIGSTLPGVDVKIAEDGEILVKGPNVMMGYFKDEAATNEAIKDGWFHTGDVGVIDDRGFLKMTDRKKALFKLSNGKYVAPQAIENMFKESVYIDQLMVIGEGEKFTSALISPNAEALKEWCKQNEVKWGAMTEVLEDPKVKALFSSAVKEFNQSIGKDEQVKRHRLVPEEWTPDTGELSPTLKLKRKVVQEKYKAVISSIFGHELVEQ
ncbi:MAG: long-chain fatty acid--CoA ligase [Crocinitomicaceae bacterium]|nr:long-chain fatty acid--CoA ligase [Crocinitomicaceae bacterium]